MFDQIANGSTNDSQSKYVNCRWFASPITGIILKNIDSIVILIRFTTAVSIVIFIMLGFCPFFSFLVSFSKSFKKNNQYQANIKTIEENVANNIARIFMSFNIFYNGYSIKLCILEVLYMTYYIDYLYK
jgi:hypothetical protein